MALSEINKSSPAFLWQVSNVSGSVSLSPCWLQASLILPLRESGLPPFQLVHGGCCDARCQGEGWSILLSSSQVCPHPPHPSGCWRSGLTPGRTHVGDSLCTQMENTGTVSSWSLPCPDRGTLEPSSGGSYRQSHVSAGSHQDCSTGDSHSRVVSLSLSNTQSCPVLPWALYLQGFCAGSADRPHWTLHHLSLPMLGRQIPCDPSSLMCS